MRVLHFLHPFIFALLPVVSLLAHNMHEMRIASALRAVLVLLGLAILLLLALRAATGDWGRSALLTSMLMLILTSYGDVYAVLKQYEVGGLILGRHRYLLPLAVATLAGGGWLVLKSIPPSRQFHTVLTVSSLAAFIIPFSQIAAHALQQPGLLAPRVSEDRAPAFEVQERGNLPDIYYIVLDAYARADTLERWFGYDNSDFLNALAERGFYVAEKSESNYFGTAVSLASTLNMNYVQDLNIDLTRGVYPSNMTEPIRDSAVRRQLEAIGYATVAFPTDYYPTEWADADYYFQPSLTPLEQLHVSGRLNSFEGLLVRGTIIQAVLDLQNLRESRLGSFVREQLDEERLARREVVLSTLDHLETVPAFDEATFTFAHIQLPHPPYIFDRTGQLVSSEALENRAGSHIADNNQFYLDQLIYTSELILETIDVIQSQSDSPPIIIIQSDHGPEPDMDWDRPTPEALRARMGILNAYHVPESCRAQLYPSISPVNSFRVLFDCLGYSEQALLEDRSYYSNLRSRSEKLDFIPVESLLGTGTD